MKKVLLWLAIVVAIAFAAIQFKRIDKTNPPIDAADVLQPPAHVQQILDRSCYDCHSNATRWPWYSNIAPISFMVAEDVEEGRRELNFSKWNSYSAKRKARKLEEICEEVEDGEMPMPKYLWTHPSAKLSAADKQTLCEWTRNARINVR